MPLSRARLLPRAIAGLCRESASTLVTVVEGSWRELVEPLRDGIVDMMIGALRDEATVPDLAQRLLFVDRLVVVARTGHPLAGTHPDLATLAAFPWVVGLPGTPLRTHWDMLFADGPSPPAPIACGSVMTIRGILREGDFLTLLSPDQVRMELDAEILTTIGPPAPGGVRRIGVATRRNWRPTVTQARFLDLLAEAASGAGGPVAE